MFFNRKAFYGLSYPEPFHYTFYSYYPRKYDEKQQKMGKENFRQNEVEIMLSQNDYYGCRNTFFIYIFSDNFSSCYFHIN